MDIFQNLRSQKKSGWFDEIDIQTNQMPLIKKLYANNGLDIKVTSEACPEQYEVFKEGNQVAYYRLRHGEFRVDYPNCGGETIYSAEPSGDGIFDTDERLNYLTKAMRAVLAALDAEATPMLAAVYLFLDDIRQPHEAFDYTKQKMFVEKEWVIVRNYNEFFKWIQTNGLPLFISFDHDLADTHYTPEPLWTDYNASKEWQEKQVHQEKTGYECAKWLVDYCIDNNLKCPEYFCHSMNPVGKDKIVGLLRSFSNSR